MTDMETRAGLAIDSGMIRFVEDEVLPGIGIAADTLWQGLADILARFEPRKIDLLAKR